MSKKQSKRKCSLPPYEVQEVLSMQEVGQQIGWEITAFNLPAIWHETKGEGVVVAVCDTGADLTHPDLVKNLLPGKNFVNPNIPPDDDNQHGTHVTGIICANNNDIGMVGVAPECKVIPVKVLDSSGNGDLDDVATGIRWAADNGADIISMSLGSPRPLANVLKAIQYAASKGVVTFVAAGNQGLSKEILYPAGYKETISIGSIDENFNRSSFSNTGDNLDFMAPGGKIFSTVPTHWYAILSGTSMACPFAVGVAALCLSWQRKHCPDKPLKTAADYRNLLSQHTVPINDPQFAGKHFFEGFGIIDPRKFTEWLVQS